MRTFWATLAFLLLHVSAAFAQTLYGPSMPVLPPSSPLPAVQLFWERGLCVAPACTVYPSHWYIYRNGRLAHRFATTFDRPVEGDSYFPVFLSTATRSIEVASANELDTSQPPRISARAAVALQTPVVVRNPTQVRFQCPDHAQDTAHELDIVNSTTGAVLQTLSVGDPAADAQGFVTFTINVQPIAFGTYIIRARSTAGAVKSPNSPDSDVWERSPGSPSKPIVQ